ncbi:universal stress protein [Oricola sp.]|uniref:universal stress protein n=1 Tax=Oricola sp. TaxID=1979950 RepID=UPI0025E8CB8D|nr:universal stress protein [Oricola sp.]MCI5078545.1 universal stress protein [Oricola sp.]
MTIYKSIMVPVDLEHESSWEKAFPVALKMAETFAASLHVVTVEQDIRNPTVMQYFPKDYEAKLVENASKRLAELVAREMPGVEVTRHVAVGQIFREIVRAAKENDCDLIVMASHRPELVDLLIGPNAEGVTRHTTASVMIVRS